MTQQVNTVSKARYFHIRQMSRIRVFLSQESVVKLVSCLVFSRLDYSNSLLTVLSTESMNKLQNYAACLALVMRKLEHIISALKDIQWLPVFQWIHYKLSVLWYKCYSTLISPYFYDPLIQYTVSHTLHSASDITRLSVPCNSLEQYGKHAFSRSAHSLWNSLPADLCETNRLFQNSHFLLLLDLVPGLNKLNGVEHVPMPLCVCVCVCVFVAVCACVCMRACVCVWSVNLFY